MTFPGPSPSLADHYRAVAEVTHEDRKRAETAEAELAECQQRAAKLALDLRSAEDRIARLVREQADSGRLVSRLRDTATQPANGERPHTGPPERCNCDMVHSHQQAIALNAGPGTRMVRDRTETAS